MTEKGCDNCYYSFFDERAYPCSLCIRGVERTDQWQPSKKTKADRKTEPQTLVDWKVNVHNKAVYDKWGNVFDARADIDDEPQTEIPEYAEWKEPFEKMTDCPWK